MDPKTLTALKASITKWEQNLKARSPYEVEISPVSCSLCTLFHQDDCEGCPVSEKTGQSRCFSTPFRAADLALTDWEEVDKNSALRDAWRKAAQAEVDFLKSLLPEGEQ